jgi:hypothetical protein
MLFLPYKNFVVVCKRYASVDAGFFTGKRSKATALIYLLKQTSFINRFTCCNYKSILQVQEWPKNQDSTKLLIVKTV